MDAKILYFKDETAWANLLISLQRPWYRRMIYQPWVSWEIHATAEAIRYVVWVPNPEMERAFKTKFYSEQPEMEIFDYTPPELDFRRPHGGVKLLTESHWTVPMKTYHNEVVDTQSELIEFLSTLKGDQEVRLQFLVQPAYRTEKDFRGILRQFERELEEDPSLEEDNKLYVSAIQGKKTRQLSRVSIKAVTFADSVHEAQQLAKACGTSLGTFSSGRLNGLKGREWWWFRTLRPLFRYEFKHRLYSMERMKRYVVLGSEEMAAMMRLPSGRVTQNKIQRIKMRRTPLATGSQTGVGSSTSAFCYARASHLPRARNGSPPGFRNVALSCGLYWGFWNGEIHRLIQPGGGYRRASHGGAAHWIYGD